LSSFGRNAMFWLSYRIARKCIIPATGISPRQLKFGLINSNKQQPAL